VPAREKKLNSDSKFGARVWNEIPASLRELPKNQFKATFVNFIPLLKKYKC